MLNQVDRRYPSTSSKNNSIYRQMGRIHLPIGEQDCVEGKNPSTKACSFALFVLFSLFPKCDLISIIKFKKYNFFSRILLIILKFNCYDISSNYFFLEIVGMFCETTTNAGDRTVSFPRFDFFGPPKKNSTREMDVTCAFCKKIEKNPSNLASAVAQTFHCRVQGVPTLYPVSASY